MVRPSRPWMGAASDTRPSSSSWSTSAQPWARVIRREIPNDAARIAALKSGQVDIINYVPATDVAALQQPLSWLHHHHLAPEGLRPRARQFQRMDLVPKEALDRRAALDAMPNLIKAYLRLGGFVGEGAFVDRPFNTTDVMLLMDTQAMSEKHREFYTRRVEGRG